MNVLYCFVGALYMATTVRTKLQKKQPPSERVAFAAPGNKAAVSSRRLEQAALDLEDAVFQVMNTDKGHIFHDVDFLYWNRKLSNIATPISLALAEYRGPKRFHYHFRHDPDDYATLYPVAGPLPLETLARVCREALTNCVEMVGIQDVVVRRERDRLESSLRAFLSACQTVRKHANV